MRKTSMFMLAIVILTPTLIYAKGSDTRSFTKSRDYAVSVKASTSNELISDGAVFSLSSPSKIESEIDLYNNLAIIRIEGARPWRIFSRPRELTLNFKGLVPGKTYYLYKEKLSNPEIFQATESGEHSITLATPRHRYIILKTEPPTYHIDSGDGGDCNTIGTWIQSFLTCELSATANIDQTIEIDDGGITLDGKGRTIIHTQSFGVYANRDPIFDDDMADIVIKNLTISGPTIGVSLIDVARHRVEGVTIKRTDTGINLKDDTDITLTRNTIEDVNVVALVIDNTNGVEVTQNNFIGNPTDITQTSSSGITLSSATSRGNFWSKFTACTQDPAPADPNHCTNRYDVPDTGVGDTFPWACKDGWKVGVECSITTTIPTTYTIRDNATGGDCPVFGLWDNVNDICTLGNNITGSVIIENTTPASPISLNGNGFSLVSGRTTPSGTGVIVSSDNVIIKDLSLFLFDTGIEVISANSVVLENTRIRDSATAILLDNASSTVRASTLEENVTGLRSINSSTLTLTNSSLRANTSVGLDVADSIVNGTNNTFTDNDTGLRARSSSGLLTENNWITNARQIDTNSTALTFSDLDSGNFWSNHTCDLDSADNTKCINSYTVWDRIFPLANLNDEHPWACSTAWSGVCAISTTTEPQAMVKPVAISDGRVRCYYPSYADDKYDPVLRHKGIDIVGTRAGAIGGKQAISVADGYVVDQRSTTGDAGLWAWNHHGSIERLDEAIVSNISTRYLHLGRISVKKGDSLNRNITEIGLVGSTGRSSGPHLHFEVRQGEISANLDFRKTTPLNPHDFLDYPAEESTTMCAMDFSSVYMLITDPDGKQISFNRNDFGDRAQYWEFPGHEVDGDDLDGDEYQMLFIENHREGDYLIEFIPRPDKLPTDIFTVILYANNKRLILADGVMLKDRPKFPVIVRSSTTGLELISDGTTKYNSMKVALCHNASKNNPHEITVSKNAVKAHLAHGDTLSKCDKEKDRGDKDGKEEKDGDGKKDEEKQDEENGKEDRERKAEKHGEKDNKDGKAKGKRK